MSYKKKNILLIIGTLVAVVLMYLLAIEKTIDYKKQLKLLETERENLQHVANKLNSLKKQSILLDSTLLKENISVTNSFQQILLKKINGFKTDESLELMEFNNPIIVQDAGVKAVLYPLIVKGNFNSLLAFLNYLENQGLAEVKNCKFIKKKNYSTRKEHLQLELYLKKIVENISK